MPDITKDDVPPDPVAAYHFGLAVGRKSMMTLKRALAALYSYVIVAVAENSTREERRKAMGEVDSVFADLFEGAKHGD